LQYQIRKNGPWLGFNSRYDSGIVAGAVPFASDPTTPVDVSGLTAAIASTLSPAANLLGRNPITETGNTNGTRDREMV
jgi:hypothetical protein